MTAPFYTRTDEVAALGQYASDPDYPGDRLCDAALIDTKRPLPRKALLPSTCQWCEAKLLAVDPATPSTCLSCACTRMDGPLFNEPQTGD